MGGFGNSLQKLYDFSFKGEKPQAPVVPPPPPPPTPDNMGAQAAGTAEAERRSRGRASTVLTGPQGLLDTNSNPKSSRTLLGS